MTEKYYAYYQIDTNTVFACGKNYRELEYDFIIHNNINDINKKSLNIVYISHKDYIRCCNGAVNLEDDYTRFR